MKAATNCVVCMGSGKAPAAFKEYVDCECTKPPKSVLIEQMRAAREADASQLHTTTWMLKRLRQMKSALQECETYFEERADAEYFTDSPDACGNEEMRLLMEVRHAIRVFREADAPNSNGPSPEGFVR